MDEKSTLILKELSGKIDKVDENVSKNLRGGLKGIRMYVDANNEVLRNKIDMIIDINKRQNGDLKDHERRLRIDEQRLQIIEENIRQYDKLVGIGALIVKRWKLVIAIFVLSIYLLHSFVDMFSISQIINFFINLKP